MSDEEKAVEVVSNFLKGDKKTLLIKGYDNEAKLRAALISLNDFFNSGIIRTLRMDSFSDFIFHAFNKELLPRTLKSTTTYKLGSMDVNISSYSSHTKVNPKGNENTFTLFHPVQMVLDNEKRYSTFIDELENTKSKKVILITTNEWSIKKWDIENLVDEVFFYDVENDNPDLMSTLREHKAI